MAMKSFDLHEFAAMRYEGSDGTQIVAVRGEVDLSSAHRLRELNWRAKRQADVDPPRVVVDLSGVEFMDTAGPEVLFEGGEQSRQPGGRMCLGVREGPVTRLLEINSLGQLFDFYLHPAAAGHVLSL